MSTLIYLCAAALVGTLAVPRPALAQQGKVVEIRSYNLKPGTRDRFHQVFLKEALPMLKRWNVDVVAYGPSLHDQDSYYLMRGFNGVDIRQKEEDAFYGSEEWIKGPRERILTDIDSYTTIVIRLDDQTIQGLRKLGGQNMAGGANELELLTKLNEDYVRSVQRSDVARFNEILSDDFLCSMPDGSLLDRQAFLAHTAKPVAIKNLQAHDVNVRLMGEVAIIHATTSYQTADGKDSGGRYTDVWAKRGGRWLAVAAHVTRR